MNKRTARRVRWSLWCLLALILLISCHGEAGRGDVVFHPTPDNIPTVTDPRFIINNEPQDTLSWMLAALREGDTVGVAEGMATDMLGSIQDIAVSDDLVYYVDRSYSHVRAYNFKGHQVDIIGGAGQGPGEFRFPMHVSTIGTEHDVYVVVGDLFASRISVFSKTPEGSHVFRTVFRAAAPLLNGDMCAMNEHVYTTGYTDESDGVIHKHTLQGEHVLSFGARYDHPDRFIRRKMSEGPSIECNATHNTLLFVYPHTPIATAFTELGDISWQIRFADARIAPKRERIGSDGGSSVMSPTPRVGESSGIRIIGGSRGNTFWLTHSERLSEKRDRWANHFYTVDVLSGQGKYLGIRPINVLLGEEDRRRIRVIDQERLITRRFTPYPQLGIHPVSDATR